MKKLLTTNLRLRRCPSWTSRPPRFGEVDGAEYHFTDKKTLKLLFQQNDLISTLVEQFGFLYGIRPSQIQKILDLGCDVLIESGLAGLNLLRHWYPGAVTIFLAPPSIETLRSRLKARGRDPLDEIEARLEYARQVLARVKSFRIDYHITNDNLEATFQIVQDIYDREWPTRN